MASSSSDLVCVQIKLKHEADPLRAVVRKRTRGHEVVELPGQNFMFTRRRKHTTPAPAPAPEAEQPISTAAAAAEAAAEPVAVEELPTEHETTGAPLPVAPQIVAEPAPAAAVVPTAFSTPAAQLLETVRWAVFNELQQQMLGSEAQVVAQLADDVTARLAQQLLGGEGGPGAAAVAAGQPSLMVLPHQVERLKQTLTEKRNMLQQEEAAWLQLQEAYAASQGNEEQEPAGEAPPAAAPGEGAGAEARTAEDVEMQDAEAAAPGVAAAQRAERADAAAPAANAADGPEQQQQGAAGGGGGHAADAAPADGSPAAAAGAAVAGAPAEAGGRRKEVCGPVAAARGAALTRVSLQVEALVGLVTKVEQLVTAAEDASRDLQACFHQERFQVFPHVNSPAFLIKSIIQPNSSSA